MEQKSIGNPHISYRKSKETGVIGIIIIILSVFSVVGSSNIQRNIPFKGRVLNTQHQTGIWMAWGNNLPNEADWIITDNPSYHRLRENVSVILNWYALHPPFYPNGSINPFRSSNEIKEVEVQLKSIPIDNFWGIIFICEEHYRQHVDFDDELNVTWFDEALYGFPTYLKENLNATRDDWRDEMYLRMLRGFYTYFHTKTNVGITADGCGVVERWMDNGDPPLSAFGGPGMQYITSNFDFVFLYAYTPNLAFFDENTRRYFLTIDEQFTKQKKFWILTRIWEWNKDRWENEALALEIKNCLDRNIIITVYLSNDPPFQETWDLVKKAFGLYDMNSPYFESPVYGNNLLTVSSGLTYGWVEK